MVFALHKANREGTLLNPSNTYYSLAYAEHMCPLYLTDELDMGGNGIIRNYRLHAIEPHALAYDINCPKCGRRMRQVGRSLSAHDLGLYTYKFCNEHRR